MTQVPEQQAAGTLEPATGAPLIRFEQVKKAFGKRVVLDDLDLSIHAGQCLVIMGPSGTGKSVTLRHIVGLIRADAGRITVAGHDMSTITQEELSNLRRRMGYLFQDGALINWLSVGENIALPLREKTRLSRAEIRAKVEQKLELVHLTDTWDKMPSEISGGMRKRVGLARALINDPEIILYDEPNAGLDPEISASINRLIRGLQERLPVTSVVISHEISCVRTVADRVVMLEGGRIAFDLPTEQFLGSSHPRIRAFLGENVD
jgi:phospholipid/cholesterol/gamma-HCH transport system ATP-binding protein